MLIVVAQIAIVVLAGEGSDNVPIGLAKSVPGPLFLVSQVAAVQDPTPTDCK